MDCKLFTVQMGKVINFAAAANRHVKNGDSKSAAEKLDLIYSVLQESIKNVSNTAKF